MIVPPALAVVTGHTSVTAMPGVVVPKQVVETVLVTGFSVQASRPVPWKLVVTAQALAGTVKVVVKFATAPGASDATEKTAVLAAGWSLTTTTLFNVMSPEFRTVPL